MAKYPLTIRQKNMIWALIPGLQDGSIKTTWIIAHGNDRIHNIGGFRNPEIRKIWNDVEDADFQDFVNCRLFSGYPAAAEMQYTLTLSRQRIFDVVDSDFEDVDRPQINHVTISVGDNSIINYQSTLTDVQQSISSTSQLNDETKAQLTELFGKLKDALANAALDEDGQEEAEVLAHHAQVAVDQLNSGKSNRKLLSISVDGLEKAAQNLERVGVPVVAFAAQIAMILRPLTG